MFNRLCEEDLAYLKKVTSPERVAVGETISPDYAHDELGGVSRMPDAVVFPVSTEEVAAVMRRANERKIPVTVRGAGTGLVGGAVALHGGILLELTKMDRVTELDEENLTVTVQPGVRLMDLASFCSERGYFYPPDPGEKSATIGGNISTNAGGMRAVKYGVTRDYVRGLTVVLPTGEVTKLGGKVVKNSTGYALKDLFVGSEGTLGVVTEAVLKLLPLPAVSVSLLVPFGSIDRAIDTVPVLVKSALSLTAIEFMERQTILFAEDFLGKRFPDTKAPAYLLLTVDGSDADAVAKERDRAAEICLDSGAEDVFIVDTEERRTPVWSARGAFLEGIKASTTEMDECDVVVPRSRVAEFVRFTHEVAEKTGMRIPSFGHAGDGNLHVYICRDGLDEETWKRKLSEVFDLFYAKAQTFEGFVSGEHGIGCAKKTYLEASCGETQLSLMRGIKAVFDPNGILNPGKIV